MPQHARLDLVGLPNINRHRIVQMARILPRRIEDHVVHILSLSDLFCQIDCHLSDLISPVLINLEGSVVYFADFHRAGMLDILPPSPFSFRLAGRCTQRRPVANCQL